METLPTLPKTVPEMWSLMRDAIGRRHVVDFFALRDLLCSILLLVEEIQQKTEQARVVEAETGEGKGEGETAEESEGKGEGETAEEGEGKGEEGETAEEEGSAIPLTVTLSEEEERKKKEAEQASSHIVKDREELQESAREREREDYGSGTEIPLSISFTTLSSESLSDLTAEPPPKKTIAEKQRMQIRQKRAQKIKGGGQLVASGTAMTTSKHTEDSTSGSGSRSSHMPGLSQSLTLKERKPEQSKSATQKEGKASGTSAAKSTWKRASQMAVKSLGSSSSTTAPQPNFLVSVRTRSPPAVPRTPQEFVGKSLQITKLEKIRKSISSEGLMPTSGGLRTFSAKDMSGSSADLGAEMSRLLVCTANIRKEVNDLRKKSLERQAKLEDDILNLYELTATLKKDSAAMMESYDLKIADLKKNITLMRKDLPLISDTETSPRQHKKSVLQSSISPQRGSITTQSRSPLQQQERQITVQENEQPAEAAAVVGRKISHVQEKVAQQRPRFSTEDLLGKSAVFVKDTQARSRIEQIVEQVDTIKSRLVKLESRFSSMSLDFQYFGSGTPDIGPGDQQSRTQTQQGHTRFRKVLAVLNRRIEAFQTQHTAELNTVRELMVAMNRENVVRWKELYKQLEEGGLAKKSHFWTSSITEAPTVIQGASDTIKKYGHGVFHPQPQKSQSEACSSDPMSQASPNAEAATSPWSLADLRKELMGHLKALRKRVTQVEMTVETSLKQAAGVGAGPSLASLPGPPEAAVVRKPLVHTFNCLSCNKRVQLTQPRVDASSFPSSEFPPRCHSSPPLSAPRGGAFIEGHASSPSPPSEFPNLHLSNPPRPCGGSYTYQAKPRRTQFFSELRETIYNAATMPGKVHIKGADGNVYKGQVSLGL